MACSKYLQLEGTDTQTKTVVALMHGGKISFICKASYTKKAFVPSLKRMKGSFAGKSLVQNGSKS